MIDFRNDGLILRQKVQSWISSASTIIYNRFENSLSGSQGCSLTQEAWSSYGRARQDEQMDWKSYLERHW